MKCSSPCPAVSLLRSAAVSVLVSAAVVQPATAGSVTSTAAIDPARFVDAGRTEAERARTLARLETLLQALARRLPADCALQVRWQEIDLAGEPEPTGRGDIRVLRNRLDGAALTLQWMLTRPGTEARSGRDELRALDNRLRPGDALKSQALIHERRLLEDWFDRRFGDLAAP